MDFLSFFIFIINALKEYVCRKGTWMTPDMIFHNLATKYIGFNMALIEPMHLNKANLRDLIAATGLVISNWIQIINFSVLVTVKFDGWPRKNNRTLLYYVKLCASFQIHWWIQTGFTVQKQTCHFSMWTRRSPFFTPLLCVVSVFSIISVFYSFPWKNINLHKTSLKSNFKRVWCEFMAHSQDFRYCSTSSNPKM